MAPKRTISPDSLPDLTLDAGNRNYPSPPNGHDLMAYFPPSAPASLAATEHERAPGGLFKKQERAYFACAGATNKVTRDEEGELEEGDPEQRRQPPQSLPSLVSSRHRQSHRTSSTFGTPTRSIEIIPIPVPSRNYDSSPHDAWDPSRTLPFPHSPNQLSNIPTPRTPDSSSYQPPGHLRIHVIDASQPPHITHSAIPLSNPRSTDRSIARHISTPIARHTVSDGSRHGADYSETGHFHASQHSTHGLYTPPPTSAAPSFGGEDEEELQRTHGTDRLLSDRPR